MNHQRSKLECIDFTATRGVRFYFLKLPEPLQDGLGWIVRFLDPWIPRSAYAIGGGTVLAARWKHRFSADIDLFADERLFNDNIESDAWDEVCEALAQRMSDGSIAELLLTPTGFSFSTSNGPVSFFSVPRMTANAISSERENSTGIFAESNAEIVFKKLRGRMVNASRYVARDLYDIVVCYGLDRESLNEAMNVLSPLERDSLRYDVRKGDTNVRDLDRVLSPSFPALVSDLDRFSLVAGEVLSQDVSDSTRRFLQQIGIQE